MLGEWSVKLRNLIALGQVWIKVILSGKNGNRVESAIQGQGGFRGHDSRFPAQNGQGTGKTKANRARVRVGRRPKCGRTRTEDFGLGQQLRMDFKTDDRFVGHKFLLDD